MYFYTWYSICVMVGAIGGMFVSCIVSSSKMADLEEELMRKDEIISSLKPHSGGVLDYISMNVNNNYSKRGNNKY